jgi:UbiD family decarboxylase
MCERFGIEAIAVGNDPAITLAAGMPLQFDEGEYEMAGALRGEPAEIIRAETVDLMVPAGAEAVLEGLRRGWVSLDEGRAA